VPSASHAAWDSGAKYVTVCAGSSARHIRPVLGLCAHTLVYLAPRCLGGFDFAQGFTGPVVCGHPLESEMAIVAGHDADGWSAGDCGNGHLGRCE
jgi:hypothetical protein